MSSDTRRWCFADQLGPHFLDRSDQPALLIESQATSARNTKHLESDQRMTQPLAGMRRLKDLDAVVEQQRSLGGRAP